MSRGKKTNEDEEVDGPRIAAKIISRLPSETRARVLQSMGEVAPEILEKVQSVIVDFNDVATLSSQGAQTLINTIEHKDLVLSLKTASEEVKNTFLQNMSKRKADLVQEDLGTLGRVKLKDVEAAQRRILDTLENLRNEGKVRTQSKNDIWV